MVLRFGLPRNAGVLILGFGGFLLQHLPEPGFLLLFRQDQTGVHSNRQTLLVPTLLTFLSVGASDVALVVVFADVTRVLHVGLCHRDTSLNLGAIW